MKKTSTRRSARPIQEGMSRLTKAFVLAVLLTGAACATTGPSIAQAPASCAQLGWDGCGIAEQCKHARAWTDDGTEVWACERQTRQARRSSDRPAVANSSK
ncbi:MAG: hypothetical protein ACI9WU_002892 [Myxococcota bacterium]|jgi:hypothetical protein